MNGGPIVDAGPALNFFAAGRQRLLFECIGGVSIPETVRSEIQAKAATDHRFSRAARVVSTVRADLLQVLPDDETEDLNHVVQRIEKTPMSQRLRQRRDLGETMVIAHAVAAAERGMDVWILIDEIRGTELAAREQRRLARMQSRGDIVGSLHIISTVTVLERGVLNGKIPDRGEMRRVYGQLSALDDGLIPLDETGLLDKKLWKSKP